MFTSWNSFTNLDKRFNSKTIIDNLFSNIAEPLIKNVATGNITFSISDNLPQFFNLTDFFSYNYTYKRNAEVYDWAGLIRTHFLMILI